MRWVAICAIAVAHANTESPGVMGWVSSFFQGSGNPDDKSAPTLTASGASDRETLMGLIQKVSEQMQRFDRMQYKLRNLAPGNLQTISRDAQTLDAKFQPLQARMVNPPTAPAEIARLIAEIEPFYHDQLLFVDGVQKMVDQVKDPGFGLPPAEVPGSAKPAAVPMAASGIGGGSGGGGGGPLNLPSLSQTAPGGGAAYDQYGSTTSGSYLAMQNRLDAAMNGVQAEMERFSSLQAGLSSLPATVSEPLIRRAQELDVRFQELQRQSQEVGGSAPMMQTMPFIENMEKFLRDQRDLVNSVEDAVAPSGRSGTRPRASPVPASG
eukprot:CAMPEP_0204375596 /NCGR_PEP_ID=MMETSP0469-20131031/49371_1 /ASSEMBLY_ACC=CAM_ASM_000384 /TAXON_ID=2969 /ORGANISM="Oxyrrhis marina" /LENGTH=322 /DNA_ID=CAMNT_0051366315 /DNA_START=10 /DNA_END=975 /DNA_ORIENTATION=+